MILRAQQFHSGTGILVLPFRRLRHAVGVSRPKKIQAKEAKRILDGTWPVEKNENGWFVGGNVHRSVVVSNMLWFATLKVWENGPIWRSHIFANRLVQPPPSVDMLKFSVDVSQFPQVRDFRKWSWLLTFVPLFFSGKSGKTCLTFWHWGLDGLMILTSPRIYWW